MMKKMLLVVAVLTVGCAAFAGSVTKLVDDTFAMGIYSDTNQMTYVDHKLHSLEGVKVLGKVEAKGSIMTVLMFVTIGDVSLEHLKREALRAYPDADDIVNIEIDNHSFGIFNSIYKHVTVTLRGVAIKYRNN